MGNNFTTRMDSPRGAAKFVHHKNGDRLDNSPENLEIMAVCRRCGGTIDLRTLGSPEFCGACLSQERWEAIGELAEMAKTLVQWVG